MKYSPVKKGLVVTCLLLIIGLIFLPSLSADESSSGNTLIYDDIEIKIYAGVNEKTNGNYGLGWVVSIKYNQSESIIGTCNITWQTLQGDYIGFSNSTFDLIPNGEIKISGIDWIHFPFPILNLNIKVEVAEIDVSRNGFEIGPFVIFNQGED